MTSNRYMMAMTYVIRLEVLHTAWTSPDGKHTWTVLIHEDGWEGYWDLPRLSIHGEGKFALPNALQVAVRIWETVLMRTPRDLTKPRAIEILTNSWDIKCFISGRTGMLADWYEILDPYDINAFRMISNHLNGLRYDGYVHMIPPERLHNARSMLYCMRAPAVIQRLFSTVLQRTISWLALAGNGPPIVCSRWRFLYYKHIEPRHLDRAIFPDPEVFPDTEVFPEGIANTASIFRSSMVAVGIGTVLLDLQQPGVAVSIQVELSNVLHVPDSPYNYLPIGWNLEAQGDVATHNVFGWYTAYFDRVGSCWQLRTPEEPLYPWTERGVLGSHRILMPTVDIESCASPSSDSLNNSAVYNRECLGNVDSSTPEITLESASAGGAPQQDDNSWLHGVAEGNTFFGEEVNNEEWL